MKVPVLSLRDIKIAQFMPVQAVQSVQGYLRSLSDLINDRSQNDPVCKHPEDFIVFKVAVFDTDTGLVEALEAPEQIELCSSLVMGVN